MTGGTMYAEVYAKLWIYTWSDGGTRFVMCSASCS